MGFFRFIFLEIGGGGVGVVGGRMCAVMVFPNSHGQSGYERTRNMTLDAKIAGVSCPLAQTRHYNRTPFL